MRWPALPSCWRFCLRCCKGWSCPWRRSTSRWSRGSLSHFIGVSLNIITFTPLAPISYHFDHACLTYWPCHMTMFASNRVANLWPTIIFDLNQGGFLPHLLCPTLPLLQPAGEEATLPGWSHLSGTIHPHYHSFPPIVVDTFPFLPHQFSVQGLLRYWPSTDSTKQLLFLDEMDNVLTSCKPPSNLLTPLRRKVSSHCDNCSYCLNFHLLWPKAINQYISSNYSRCSSLAVSNV